MAEYNEVIKQFKRMCWYYSRDKMQKSCPMCISYPNCNIGQCRKIAFEKPAHFAATVMCWAAEHPESVYPSVAKYLERLGITIRRDGTVEADFFKANEPMNADVAKLLGIEPKEG